ncbi:hypothetical protein MRB53_031160 [Persea americana]|uniref:Uncharacterized protein n=1 Tax=Persea americana TaxID=3435 RepID=A0ACC2KN81_PERAE|nr:hypothetical protein MRB53_031160 [Persea americana]
MNERKRSTLVTGENNRGGDSGFLEEKILILVFVSINWDPNVLGWAAYVSRKLRAVAKRILWRELCASRVPPMVNIGRGNGWDASAKIFFYCCGCVSSSHFTVGRTLPGHFVGTARFSKTPGKSFIGRRCREELLYSSHPCEHNVGSKEDNAEITCIFKAHGRS